MTAMGMRTIGIESQPLASISCSRANRNPDKKDKKDQHQYRKHWIVGCFCLNEKNKRSSYREKNQIDQPKWSPRNPTVDRKQ
jgi:hypothetical protein